MDNYTFQNGNFVAGIGEHTYQEVIEDFQNTKFIGVITFNISKYSNGILIEALKKACNGGVHATVITNIPKRFKQYYGNNYANAAKQVIESYIRLLDAEAFGMRLSAYFDFTNHAKIIMTDNVAYIGSENYSDEGRDNYECGVICRDSSLIRHLKDEVFSDRVMSSIPYYKYNIAEAIAILRGASSFCIEAKGKIYDAAFTEGADYETDFKPVSVYKSNDSGITASLLSRILDGFGKYEDALKSVQDVIDYYYDKYEDNVPEQIESLEELYDSYKTSFEEMQRNLSDLFEEISQLAHYNYDDEVCRIVNEDYGMESFDENLDYYMQLAMNESNSELEALIESAEPTIRNILQSLDAMKDYYERMDSTLYSILEINDKIDNT